MANLNPAALVLVAFCVAIGAIFGAALVGLACGLGVVLVGTIVD